MAFSDDPLDYPSVTQSFLFRFDAFAKGVIWGAAYADHLDPNQVPPLTKKTTGGSFNQFTEGAKAGFAAAIIAKRQVKS